MPPGSGKSTYTSVRFPTYYLGKYPKHDLIQASNTSDLASRFGRKSRNLINSSRFSCLFDVKLAADSQAKNQWEVIPEDEEEGGEYYAIGVEGAVTGRRADGGLIDDPIKGKVEAASQRTRERVWDWYLTEFCTRIKPGGFKVIVQTRWDADDLSGRILPEDWDGKSGWVKGQDGEVWYVLTIQAEAEYEDELGRQPGEWLWPEWFSGDFWDITKARTPPRDWSALYQQRPSPLEGLLFKRQDCQWYVPGDQPSKLNRFVMSDFAVTEDQSADYTVFGDWGVDQKGHWWLLETYREQAESTDWVKVLAGDEDDNVITPGWFKTKKPFKFFGETGVIRRAIEPWLRRRMQAMQAYCVLEWINRPKDKVAMSTAFLGMWEMGMIHLPLNEQGEQVMGELVEFPTGANDDSVDMCALIGLAVDQGLLALPEPKPEPGPSGLGDYKAMDEDVTGAKIL